MKKFVGMFAACVLFGGFAAAQEPAPAVAGQGQQLPEKMVVETKQLQETLNFLNYMHEKMELLCTGESKLPYCQSRALAQALVKAAKPMEEDVDALKKKITCLKGTKDDREELCEKKADDKKADEKK